MKNMRTIPGCDLRALLLHVSADGRIAQFSVQLFEAREERQSERARHHVAGRGALLTAVFAAASTAAIAKVGTLRYDCALRAVLAGRTADVDVMALANVFDVLGDGGVRADAMLVHQRNQLGLLQVVGRLCVFRTDVQMADVDAVAVSKVRHLPLQLVQAQGLGGKVEVKFSFYCQ